MHLVIMLDRDRLTRDELLIDRLTADLIDLGTAITQVVPASMLEEDAAQPAAGPSLARIAAPMRVLPWMRRSRADRLADALQRTEPELIYVSGRGAWSAATDLAQRLEIPIVFDVVSEAEARTVPRGRTSSQVGGYAAGTSALAELLKRRADAGLVSVVPIGADIPGEPNSVLGLAPESMSVAVIADGRNMRSVWALLAGLARVMVELPQLQGILVTGGRADHDLWRAVRKARLGRRISLVPDLPGQRLLLTQADLLVVAEDLGEARTLVLDSMARGVPVVAHSNPMMDMLIPQKTARIVTQPTEQAWEEAISELLRSPEKARELGLGGRAWVAARHTASEQAQRLQETCQQVLTGGAIPISGST